MEQDNMKQLELQKKEKKKGEEEKRGCYGIKEETKGRGGKEREGKKRMCVEARRQQREHEDKLPAEKDGRCPGGKKSKDERKIRKWRKKRGFDNSRNILETEPNTSRISVSNAGRESIVHEEFHEASSNYGYKAEVPSNLDREMENSIGITSQEQSYDISPYKESDDENDDDDNVIPNSKFIPSWSSKNCLAFAVSCRIEQTQRRSSPKKAFAASLKSSCPETIN